jgi:hypothetical protein
VVTIQPGGVRSSFGDHAEEGIYLPEDSLYQPAEALIRARAQAGQQGATPVDEFIAPVVEKMLQERPPVVIRGGKNSFRVPLLKTLLPTRRFDAMVSKVFGLDRFHPQ